MESPHDIDIVSQFIIYVLRNTHHYVVNFRSQISSSKSEERTMVFTREKMIRPIRLANDVLSRVRKMIGPIRSHRGM